MRELSDEELDRLGRDAAEQYPASATGPSWERMEAALAREMPEGRKRRRRGLWWFFLLGALLAGGALMFLPAKQTPPPHIAHHTAKPVTRGMGQTDNGIIKQLDSQVVRPEAPVNTIEPAVEQDFKPEDLGTDEVGLVVSFVEGSVADPGNAATDMRQTDSLSTNSEAVATLADPQAASAETITNEDSTGDVNRVDGGKDLNPQLTFAAPDSLTANDARTIRASMAGATPLERLPLSSVKKIDVPQIPRASTRETAASKKIANLSPRRIEIGVVGGTDWSNVAFKQSSTPGYNIGASIGVRLTNRLVVTTGILYTKKNYEADSQYYNTKFRWLNYYDRFYGAEGSCNMFEIPVQLRFDMIAAPNARVFVAGGLNSYLMTRERFNYRVQDNGVDSEMDWKNPDPKNYFFSVLNLSAGFEKTISSNFSLQIEPYAKVPLRYIGYGGLRLNSVGMNAALKYRFGKTVR